MANNISVKDASASTQVLKTTDTSGVHTPHHLVDGTVAVTDNGGSLTVDGTVELGAASLSALENIQVTFPSTQNVSVQNATLAVTDNGSSLTVDGTVTANAGTGTFAVSAESLPLPSGAATSANQTTANTSLSNIDTDLGAQADASASSDTGTFSLISLFKRLLSRITSLVPANLTVTSTRLLVDGSGVTQPVSGTITANAGTGTYAIQPRNGAVTKTRGTTSSSANTSAAAPSPLNATDSNRRYLLIQNISDTDMYVNFGAAATTDDLLISKNGGGVVFEAGYVPTDSVNVICSAASKKYFILSA